MSQINLVAFDILKFFQRRFRMLLREMKLASTTKKIEAFSNNTAAEKFLAFGFDFSNERFDEVLADLRASQKKPKSGLNAPSSIAAEDFISNLQTALHDSVKAELDEKDADAVRVGITGGLDSRLLYSVVCKLLPAKNITTYTYGYPGQYDFEFVQSFGKKFLPADHITLDTKDIHWSFEDEVKARKRAGKSGSYSSKRLHSRMLAEMGAPEKNVHGFMGDVLVGIVDEHYGNELTEYVTWNRACELFFERNNRWRLQELFDRQRLRKLLPPEPSDPIANVNNFYILDYGLRQFQRIMTNSTSSKKTITPFANKRWMGAMTSMADPKRREKLYFEFLKQTAPDVFPELLQNDITSKKEHKAFRSQVSKDAEKRLNESRLIAPSGKRYVQQLKTPQGDMLAGRQFCEFAEYHNSPSFRAMVDTAMERLASRDLIPIDVFDKTWTLFHDRRLRGAESVRGLVSFELCLSADVF